MITMSITPLDYPICRMVSLAPPACGAERAAQPAEGIAGGGFRRCGPGVRADVVPALLRSRNKRESALPGARSEG